MVDKAKVEAGIPVVELLAQESQVFSSNGELKRTVQQNGLAINKKKIASFDDIINASHLIANKYITVQKGKKDHFLLIVK